METTIGNVRVWTARLFLAPETYLVGASAYVPSTGEWQMILWECYATRDDRDRRRDDLIEGFRSHRYAPFYFSQEDVRFAVIQQKSANLWLWRVHMSVTHDPDEQTSPTQRESKYRVFWADRVWSLPFEERPEEWKLAYSRAMASWEMRFAEGLFSKTDAPAGAEA